MVFGPQPEWASSATAARVGVVPSGVRQRLVVPERTGIAQRHRSHHLVGSDVLRHLYRFSYVVDSWAKIESNDLNYIRHNHVPEWGETAVGGP